MNEDMHLSMTEELVISRIYQVREKKIMLDRDLAEMYGVETKRLNEAVKRNLKRFPDDFMFQLTEKEFTNLMSQMATLDIDESSRSQIATLNNKRGQNMKYLPYAFTEQGVAMLSGILNSDRAIAVNIHIMRVYTKMRELMLTHKDILLKMEELETKVVNQDEKVAQIFHYLKQFVQNHESERVEIGYKKKSLDS